MSEDEAQRGEEATKTAIYRRRPLRIIWLLPVIALGLAGWFLYNSLSSRGPEITIQFETADGLEISRSEIKHKDVVLGTVVGLRPVDRFKHVEVTARMNRLSEDYLNKDTKFWIVRPRVSAEGITGLNTLLSGVYIEMAPGGGDKTYRFLGLEAPPLTNPDIGGKAFTLLTDDLGTLEQGSAVIYHGVKVGEILGYRLSADRPAVTVQIFITDPYTGLVHTGTKFWNASGVEVSVGAQGLNVAARSLQTIFLGGVMFDVPKNGIAGPPANDGDKFTLFGDQRRAEEAVYTAKVRFLLRPQGSIAGLAPGDDVTMFGRKIGQVDEAYVEFDVAAGTAEPLVVVGIEPERLNFKDLDAHSPDLDSQTSALFERLVAQRLRAQLIASNPLTRQMQVDFGFVDDAAPAKIVLGGAYPEFPTAPAEDLSATVRSLRKTLNSVDAVISSPQMKHSIQELDKSLSNIDGITRQTNAQIGPLLTQLRAFADSADGTLKKADSAGGNGGDLSGTLRELREAARSVRNLADYLENHPESLLRGKPK
ncbi:MAG: paraquat-inducible protein [Rhodospirillales bacterium]|nr:paraquat-inducible protein [Rhodospirillales bacterium]